jgi:hypothetical protein
MIRTALGTTLLDCAMTWEMYAAALRALGKGPWEGESISFWAQRRYGREWCRLLPHAPPRAVLLPQR